MTHRTAALVLAAGGALLAIGSLLPWTVARTAFASVERPGTDGDGVVTLGLGALLLLIGLVRLDKPVSRLLKTIAELAAIAAAVVLVLIYQSIVNAIGDLGTDVEATIGVGFYIAAVGAVAALVGAASLHREGRTDTVSMH